MIRILAGLAVAAAVASAQSATRYVYSGASARASLVRELTVGAPSAGWQSLHAVKPDGSAFDIWKGPSRYLVRWAGKAREFRHGVTGEAVTPSAIPLEQLLPQAIAGSSDVMYLGHRYSRAGDARPEAPPEAQIVVLRPDLMLGPPSNRRPKDDRRRWDGSDYELVRLTRDDYRQMAEAGITCVRADDDQSAWAEELGMYHWGGGQKLAYPEMLYDSQYLGPAIFLDEPAVSTRDHVLRPRLAKDPAFRKSIRPSDALAAFETYYKESLEKGAPARLRKMLEARADVDLGSFVPEPRNLYTWETMISTAVYQLSHVPEAIVFEPPGRIGTRRTLPEINMTYGTQFAIDDAKAFADLIFSFLRGAARQTQKSWGISIYGAVDRADSFWWMTHAYDMGATRFHFWDNYQLACVPFGEILALARHLRNHAASNPNRDLSRLRRAAEVAILLPPGYDLGHTQMGRGPLWGIGELNLERGNYREVMSAYFAEVERCARLGIAYDSMWDLPGLPLEGYREVVRASKPRPVERKPGEAPRLSVTIENRGMQVIAKARVRETAAPVFYTNGTDEHGVYRNALVLWELFGPNEEDYIQVPPDRMQPTVRREGADSVVEAAFRVERAGSYRLRAATVDAAGRSRVVWTPFTVAADARQTVETAPGAASEARR